ncbi:DUF4625 domain-containing protein [Flammeovirga sp. SubArs3]|uniref:DUF4625 domain-containing protein n=1 Tax=Flammeovirga sp. SubArs3 TaxID=2995316 RepID=UPI00248B8D2C|nr:DUF4625 domain-containing protein [Flammeovirga sp. SubArs3]
MKKHLLKNYLFLIIVLFGSVGCQDNDEFQKELVQIYEIETDHIIEEDTTEYLGLNASFSYIDFAYLRVDIKPTDEVTQHWNSTFIYDDLTEYEFHGQYSIPKDASGEYEIILYLSDKNGYQTQLSQTFRLEEH